MKRVKLVDRVVLLAEREAMLRQAADMPTESAYHRDVRIQELKVAAIRYADVARRYLGGSHGG